MSTETTAPRSKTTQYVLLAILLVGFVATGVALFNVFANVVRVAPTPTPQEGVTTIDPPRALADFTLRDVNGDLLSLSDLRGKYALLFFGYTHCPDFCPTTMAVFTQIRGALGAQAEQVNFVLVSVDGERDTPTVLKDYLAKFDPTFIGMTGDEATLRRLAPDYGLYFELRKDEADEKGDYPVDHSTASYLIDPQGQMVTVYSYGTRYDVMAADIARRIEREG